jgi:hypothetical protein
LNITLTPMLCKSATPTGAALGFLVCARPINWAAS